jgi:hypothetical protein
MEQTKPRVALMMSGLPRFRADTDTLINNLTNYESIDWYVAFWKHTPHTESYHDARWQSLSEEEMIAAIQSRLPSGQTVKTFNWVSEEQTPPMPRDYPAFYNIPKNFWQQYVITHIVNQIRHSSNIEYDLVIRGRADAGSNQPIDLSHLNATLGELELHMPGDWRYGPYGFNDHWCIGRPLAVDHLCNAINQFDYAFQQGVPYNAEVMLGTILHHQGLTWPITSWGSTLKTNGTYTERGFDPVMGRWALPD